MGRLSFVFLPTFVAQMVWPAYVLSGTSNRAQETMQVVALSHSTPF